MPISYGDAQPLLAALEGPGGARGLARRAAHHLSRRPRARQGPPEAEVQLGPQAALRRDRAHPGQRRSRTSGSSAAIITTPGSTAPRIRSRASAPLMEEARALGDAAQAGLEAEAHHHLLRVGRRGARPARLDRMGRDARRRAAAQGGGLHQLRWQRPRLPAGGRLAHAREVHQRRRPGHRRSRRRRSPSGSACRQSRADRATPTAGGRATKLRTRADLRIGALGSGSDYTAFLDHLGHRVAEHRLRRRGSAAASTTRSTTISTGTRISPTPISSTAARWRRPPAPP